MQIRGGIAILTIVLISTATILFIMELCSRYEAEYFIAFSSYNNSVKVSSFCIWRDGQLS